MKLYNTLSKKKENFKPIKGKDVGMYSCGPTVYDYAHIGNFRAYVVADLLKRYLKYKGYKVKHVMNITDVDDKTIRDSKKAKLSLKSFTKKYEKAFFEDLKKLNIEKANYFPRATENIKGMVSLIKNLLKKGYAYEAKDGIYYKVSKFKRYDELAGLDMSGLQAGARVKNDEYSKEKVNDFALWKYWSKEDGKVFWDTEIGKGRPGWHIECSVMSTKYLGKHFDIHTGGIDLVFPHHTNEIAQSEAADAVKFVNYWVHNEHLLVDGRKMSKSLGNFYTLRDILEKYDAMAVRYLLINSNYRQTLNFTFRGLGNSEQAIDKLKELVKSLKKANGKNEPLVKKFIAIVKTDFEKAMDNDLNVPEALSSIFKFMHEINKIEISKKNAKDIIEVMKGFDKVLGLDLIKIEKRVFSKEIKDLIKKRDIARRDRDWETSDKIRESLLKKDIKVSDAGNKSIYT